MTVPPAALVLAAYLLGSISFAVLVVRSKTGQDIRAEGSGNAGATNVLRAHGKKLAILVALLDVAKGAAAVLLMRLVTADPRWVAAAGFAAVLGHVFPVFYSFRGGKGVATAVGAFAVLTPLALLVSLGVFVVDRGRDALRLARVGRLDGPPARDRGRPFRRAPRGRDWPRPRRRFVVIAKHLANLKRLAAGTERKLGKP